MSKNVFQEMVETARRDAHIPSVNEMVDLENLDRSYLDGKSMRDISQEIYDVLVERLHSNPEQLQTYYKKLEGYRLVERVCDLRMGTQLRPLLLSDMRLAAGGILVKIDVQDEGVGLLCKSRGHFQRYSFNHCLVFHKLTVDEQMILVANEADMGENSDESDESDYSDDEL